MARTSRARTRISSYRDARSSSLQRMVRRRWLEDGRPKRGSGSNARTRDRCRSVYVWKAGIGLAHAMEDSPKPPRCRDARSCCAWSVWARESHDRRRAKVLSKSRAALACELWKRRLRNRREATESQAVGLAIDSPLEVFKPWVLVDGIGLGMSSKALIARMRCAKSPNDWIMNKSVGVSQRLYSVHLCRFLTGAGLMLGGFRARIAR